MAIVFSCGCGKQLQAKEEYAGRRIRCPKCQKVLTIPGGEAKGVDMPASAMTLQPVKTTAEGRPPTLLATAAVSPWFDAFLGQKLTPWRPGDEVRFQKGVVPPRDRPHRLLRWLVVLFVAGGLSAAAYFWLPEFLGRVQARVAPQGGEVEKLPEVKRTTKISKRHPAAPASAAALT